MQNQFVRAASVGELAPGDMKLVEMGGKMAALANVDGHYFAFSDTCTHLECSLAEGTIEGEAVECPCHGSQFNVKTGAVVEGPAHTPIAVYAVRVQGNDILVGPA